MGLFDGMPLGYKPKYLKDFSHRKKAKPSYTAKEAQILAPQYLRQVEDCTNLVNSTVKPDIYFKRYDMMVSCLVELKKMQKVIKFSGKKPSAYLNEVIKTRDEQLNYFIERIYRYYFNKISSLKTAKSKQTQIDKFTETMAEISCELSDSLISKVQIMTDELRNLSFVPHNDQSSKNDIYTDNSYIRYNVEGNLSSNLFDKELSSIPLVNIKLSSKYIKTNYVKEMQEVVFNTPRVGSKYSGYGNFVVIDTETTGISVSNEIIEISAIKFENFKATAAFSTLINPKDPIPKEITDITQITNDMVKNSPTIYQVMPAFIEFVGGNDILGHNLRFDLEFVYKYGFKFQEVKRRYFDSLDIAKNKIKGLDNYKLTTLCNFYGIVRSNAHRSLSDCYATAKVYINLLDKCRLLK